FLASSLSLLLLPRAVSGSQRPLQVWQEWSEFPLRRDSRPGLWNKASHGQRRLLEQGHQDDGPAPTKDTDQPQAGGTPQPQRHGGQGRDLRNRAGGGGAGWARRGWGTGAVPPEPCRGGWPSSPPPPTPSSHKAAPATPSHRRAA